MVDPAPTIHDLREGWRRLEELKRKQEPFLTAIKIRREQLRHSRDMAFFGFALSFLAVVAAPWIIILIASLWGAR